MEDWLKKYHQNRQQGMNPLAPGRPTAPRRDPRQLELDFDGDISNTLASRIAQKAAMAASGGSNETSEMVDLVEGYPYYLKLQVEPFGHTVSLFKTAGIIGGATSKNVQMGGERSGYLIDGMNTLDMAKINERLDLKVSLVEVSVPLHGTYLVPKEAVIRKGSGPFGDGRRLLRG